MNTTKKCIALTQMFRRYASGSVQEVPSSSFNKVKDIQKQYQCDDGIPSYLKGGFKDKVLFQITLLLTVVGLGMSGETLWKLTFKN